MNDSPKRRKGRPTLVEGLNNVPHLLEKARQAVDDVTQTAPQDSVEPRPARRERTKAASPKKPAKETGGPKAPAPPAAEPEEPPAAAPPALETVPETRIEPRWDLGDYGISVKHAIPGRIRLRLGRMLHNEELAEKLPALLAAVPGVTSAEASTATGSLLITFNCRELAMHRSRQDLAAAMRRFFPGLDTEPLVKRMLDS